MNLLKGSVFLKLAALIVAVLTYSYIQHEITNRDHNSVDPSYKLIKLTAKNLPVNVRFETEPPAGYRIVEENVIVTPPFVTAIGPEALLEEVATAETSTVDVSEYTRTITKQVPLESVAGIHLVGQPYMVVATVPIEKISGPEEMAPVLPAAALEPVAPPVNS